MWTYQHLNFRIHQVGVLRDNYIYILEDCHSDIVLVIDPALAQPVLDACQTLQIQPTHILNTHHHWDHTDGNLELIQVYQCTIIGNQADQKRIPGISQPIPATTSFDLGALHIQTLDVPGHTLGHIVYIIDDALFCGDTLFGAGCGRLFEGSHQQMWESLQKLATLTDMTKVYCAHEYTLPNLKFAYAVDGDNKALQQRIQCAKQARRAKQPTIPSTIALEKQTNPFLRPLDSSFCQQFNQQTKQQHDGFAIFKALRQRKDAW